MLFEKSGRDVDARTRLYIAAVCVAGSVSLGVAFLQYREVPLGALVLFAGLAFVSESLAVEMPHSGKISVSFSIYLAALVLFGPMLAALAALVGEFNWSDIRNNEPLHKLIFNAAQMVVSVVVAAMAYAALGGAYGSAWSLPAGLIPILGASVAFVVVNDSLVTIVIASSRNLKPMAVWRANALPYMGNNLALLVLAMIMVNVYIVIGAVGVLLLIAPLLVARQAFQIYAKLREAYQATVHSLVAAIEAKDAYTRGHSERVADYAEMIGRRLQMPEDQVDKLRIAALLHDLGKIGIQRRILSKTGRLSEEEFTLMQEHPELATTILQDVDFLEDIIPTIYHHHEHYDGSGYAKSLRGNEIPLAARILSVADAYDAMISARPYREARAPEAAAAELLCCADSQFDRRVVDALLAATGVRPRSDDEADLAEGQMRIVEDSIQ